MIEIHLDKIDSTQDFAKKNYASFDANQITCIIANEQIAGHGRYQRPWVSPRGVNIYATFYFRLPSGTKDLTTLAQLMALSLSEILLKEGLLPKIKWPNDILLHGKKVSGILCETIFEKAEVALFLGIGINVNMEIEILSTIDQPATSLKIETQRIWDLKALLKKLQDRFAEDLMIFKENGFAPFQERLQELCRK